VAYYDVIITSIGLSKMLSTVLTIKHLTIILRKNISRLFNLEL